MNTRRKLSSQTPDTTESASEVRKLGVKMLDELFSRGIFWQWILYGVFQGVAAFYVTFLTLCNTDPWGTVPSSVSVDGQLVFTGVVTLVNLKILFSSHNFTFFSFFLTLGSALFFVLSFYLLNLLDSTATADIYSQFQYVFTTPTAYLALFLMGTGMGVLENGTDLVQTAWAELRQKQEQRGIEQAKALNQKDASVQRRRATNINCNQVQCLTICRPRIRILAGAWTGSADHREANGARNCLEALLLCCCGREPQEKRHHQRC